MSFSNPGWLAAGLLACVLLVWVWRRHDARQHAALARFVAAHLRIQLTRSISVARRRAQRGLFLAALALLFVALAGPLVGYRWEQISRRGNEIIFAIDTSRSMSTPDIKPNRLTRAKLAIDDFANRLDGDGVGIVAFAGSAFLVCPITLDYGAFHESLSAIDTNTIPRGGTNISSAIHEAQTALRRRPGSDRILILVTDGEDLEGSALIAAQTAKQQDGLTIFAVGVGTAGGDLIPVPPDQGGGFVKDETGGFVKSRLDEPALKALAAATGGFYVPLGTQGEGLDTIFRDVLGPLAKHDLASRQQKIYTQRYQWPLAASLGLLLASLLVGTRRRAGARKRKPITTNSMPGGAAGATPRVPAGIAASRVTSNTTPGPTSGATPRVTASVAASRGTSNTKPGPTSGAIPRVTASVAASRGTSNITPGPTSGATPRVTAGIAASRVTSNITPSPTSGAIPRVTAGAAPGAPSPTSGFPSGATSRAASGIAARVTTASGLLLLSLTQVPPSGAATSSDKPAAEYNRGTTAYRAGQYPQAAQAFQQSISQAPSSNPQRLADQEDAYYNLGNTLYRTGQKSEKSAPQEALQKWTDAVKAYETALQLRPDDADSKFNRDLVKRKIEALKQNPNQNQNQNKNPQQNQGQNQGQNKGQGQPPPGQPPPGQQSQGQPPPGQQSQGQPPPGQQPPGQQPPPQQPNPNASKGDQPPPQSAGQPPPAPAGGEPQPKDPSNGNPGQPPNDAQAADNQRLPGQMSREEARELLDSVKGDERRPPTAPLARREAAGEPPEHPIKNW